MPDEKMKYPLLEFEYDKKLYEELLTLNPHPEFMDRVSIVTEDYEHDDFGSLPGDEKKCSRPRSRCFMEDSKIRAVLFG